MPISKKLLNLIKVKLIDIENKPLTIKQIKERLGLDDREPDPSIRRSGNTTEMLVWAVHRSQFQKVLITGYRAGYSRDLQKDAKSMCMKLNIPHDNIILMNTDNRHYLKDTQGMNLYCYTDHFWGDDRYL